MVPYSPTGPSFPSSVGGGNWGGVAFDPSRALIFVNTSEMGRARWWWRGAAVRAAGWTWRGAAVARVPRRWQEGCAAPAPGIPNSNRFVDPNYYPCNQPPWGLLTRGQREHRRHRLARAARQLQGAGSEGDQEHGHAEPGRRDRDGERRSSSSARRTTGDSARSTRRPARSSGRRT